MDWWPLDSPLQFVIPFDGILWFTDKLDVTLINEHDTITNVSH